MATRVRRRKNQQEAADGMVEATRPRTGRRAKTAWKLMDRSTTMAARAAAPLLAAGVWRLMTGKRPPTTSENPELDVREALTWALVGGALVEVVKVAVRRRTAQYWVRSTGELPPGMASLVDQAASGDLDHDLDPAQQAPSARKQKSRKRR